VPGVLFPVQLPHAEERWNQTTPSDRVVLLKNVLSNLSLEGATLQYDLKTSFRLLAQIKNKGVTENWCAWRDSNPHTFRHQILSLTCLPVSPQAQRRVVIKNREQNNLRVERENQFVSVEEIAGLTESRRLRQIFTAAKRVPANAPFRP
jgi:hypothetical protein